MNAPDCICSPGRLPLGAFCAGRDDLEREALHDDRISIRAPRAGCDFLRLQDIARALISIHAPRVGRDCIPLNPAEQPENFNPRAPCGARHEVTDVDVLYAVFQSTRPVWGATSHYRSVQLTAGISIHAPRVGRDWTVSSGIVIVSYFNPRAPCGARPLCCYEMGNYSYFNPRAPCGARPEQRQQPLRLQAISIHAPRVGRDRSYGFSDG